MSFTGVTIPKLKYINLWSTCIPVCNNYAATKWFSLEEDKEEEERIWWMKCVDGHFQNTDFERDSGEVNGCSKHRYTCTALLDDLNRMILWHNKGTPYTSYYCLGDAIFVTYQFDSWFWQTYRSPCMHISRYPYYWETQIQQR